MSIGAWRPLEVGAEVGCGCGSFLCTCVLVQGEKTVTLRDKEGEHELIDWPQDLAVCKYDEEGEFCGFEPIDHTILMMTGDGSIKVDSHDRLIKFEDIKELYVWRFPIEHYVCRKVR